MLEMASDKIPCPPKWPSYHMKKAKDKFVRCIKHICYQK